MNKDLQKLLDSITQDDDNKLHKNEGEVILIIDGLNLFLRNFAILNYVNPQGVHVGGLGGFMRSLGSLVKTLQPTSVYITFDGVGSTVNRKNLIPEYKSNRHQNRITNWNSFKDIDEETESKYGQIGRLIHYLKCLPVKILSIDQSEADDIIAFLSLELVKKPKNKIYIVSADNDFLQLVNDQVIVYRPIEKEFYTPKLVKEKFGIHPENFLIYKTLMGDTSDVISKVKGLGKKKLKQLFPELYENKVTLDELYDICEKKHKDHIIYSRAIFGFDDLRRNYKVMDLSNPMLDDKEKGVVSEIIIAPPYELNRVDFMLMYNEDGLGSIIRNTEYWIKECWDQIDRYHKSKTK